MSSNPGRVVITVNNVPPSPFAGIDQALTLGETITLNGKGSADANDETKDLAYAWSRPAGSGGFNTAIAAPSVLPALVGTYDFGLTATDPAGNSATDRVFVVVHQGANQAAGPSVPKRITAVVGHTVVDRLAPATRPGRHAHLPLAHLQGAGGCRRRDAAAGGLADLEDQPRAAAARLLRAHADRDAMRDSSPPAAVGIVADFRPGTLTARDRVPVATGNN